MVSVVRGETSYSSFVLKNENHLMGDTGLEPVTPTV